MRNNIFFLIIPFLLSSCSMPVKVNKWSELANHMLSLDRDGKKDCEVFFSGADGVNCKNISDADKTNALYSHVELIGNSLDKALASAKYQHRKLNLLIFVHGGLVSKNDATTESQTILSEITKQNSNNQDPDSPIIYPIFLNWESGMDDAYADHLYRIRQGRESDVLGPFSLPFYLLADLGRAFTRLPITYGFQGYNAIKTIDEENISTITKANTEFYEQYPAHNSAIGFGEDTRSSFDKVLDKSTYLVPGVARLMTTPVLDSVGKASWDNMLRRTRLVFRTADDYQEKTEAESLNGWDAMYAGLQPNTFTASDNHSYRFRDSTVGFSVLMRVIQKVVSNHGTEKPTITLIGHSMGTIVLSELLRQTSLKYPDLAYKHIVFMGAACTIHDFETAVVPYIISHQETDFYNLTLHPYAEENESNMADLVPRGSLLVWIDDFASTPTTRSELTLGRWSNAKIAWPFIPEKVRDRITLKAFGMQGAAKNQHCKKIPMKHGEFNDANTEFWNPDFWSAKQPCVYQNTIGQHNNDHAVTSADNHNSL